jgi:hypothetical protein
VPTAISESTLRILFDQNVRGLEKCFDNHNIDLPPKLPDEKYDEYDLRDYLVTFLIDSDTYTLPEWVDVIYFTNRYRLQKRLNVEDEEKPESELRHTFVQSLLEPKD